MGRSAARDRAASSQANVGWLARQSMSLRVTVATLFVTVLVMGIIIAVIAWQSRTNAVEAVKREMHTALEGADQSLQLVFQAASQRGRELLPVLIRSLGGEPVLDGTMVETGEAGQAPRLVIDGRTINGDTSILRTISENTGADPAIILKVNNRWVRAATLLKDEQGRVRIGSTIDPNDLIAKTLDKGVEFSGLVQRSGEWFALSIKPLRSRAGSVYGALTVRVNVNADVLRLLDWVNKTTVAEHGTLAVLRRAPDGQGWIYLAGGGSMAGERMGDSMAPQERANLEALYNSQTQGFAETPATQAGGARYVSWLQVANWDWLMIGRGERSAFLATSNHELLIQVILMVLGTALIAGLIGWLAAVLLRPLHDVMDGMMYLGEGDLTHALPDVPDNSRSEVHALFGSLKRTQQNLMRTVQAVRRGVDEINVGATEISAGNTDLSSRTEQQAASLEETAASMQELASTVKQNADNAREANHLAKTASEVAEKGGHAVSTVVNTMQEISASSRKISEIVSVIDGIAFQTNILALNAAVEAARAGEQGKGFAVVAGEVRTLAQRSAQAAKEIKTLIEESVNKVGQGSLQVEQAGSTMQEVVVSVKHVTDIMSEISAASHEQSGGIDQVNRAVAQMDEVTQQNAALVEQAAAAAGSLQEQASQLMQAISVFRLQGVGNAYSSIESAHRLDSSYGQRLQRLT